MKKILIILILLVVLSNSVFGADFSLSTGAGGLLGYNFTRYTMEGGGLTSYQDMDRLNYAGFLFFDATYVELAVLFQGGSNTWVEKLGGLSFSDKGTGLETSLGISLLGKYPFNINERITWFPLLGVEYHIALLQRRTPDGLYEYNRTEGHTGADRDKNGDSYPLHAWNSFWIDMGAGLDYNLTGSFFLRTELIFGFRLMTEYEAGALEMFKHQTGDKNPSLFGLTGGPSLKIGVGYRF